MDLQEASFCLVYFTSQQHDTGVHHGPLEVSPVM
jgi:hypothetical protein